MGLQKGYENMVNTVCGKISVQEMGNTLCHEHIMCVNPSVLNAFGENWVNLDRVKNKAVEMFKQAKEECGIDTIIDGTPIDLGRDIEIMRKVSSESGVNIVASSGIYPSEEPFLAGKKPEKFAENFINECQGGIGNTKIKPGILKCATGRAGFTDINKMLITTMAIVQKETNLPIFAHNEHSIKTPYKQIQIFEKNGVNLDKVIIGHCSDSNDADYLEDILKSGCFVGFDRIYPTMFEHQAETIAELIRRGWEDKILVSHDHSVFIDWFDTTCEKQFEAHLDRNFTNVYKRLFPELEKLGVEKRQIQKLMSENIKTLFLN